MVLSTLLLSYQIKAVNGQFSMSFSNGSYTLEAWMIDNQTVRFQTAVPNNQYFSIGFFGSMTNTDIVSWEAND